MNDLCSPLTQHLLFPIAKSAILICVCVCGWREPFAKSKRAFTYYTHDVRVQFHNNSSNTKCDFRFLANQSYTKKKKRRNTKKTAQRKKHISFTTLHRMEIDINYLSVRRMRSEQVTNECGDVVLNVAPKLHMAEREFRLRIISTSPTPLFCRTSTVAHCTRLRFVHQIHGDTRTQNLKKKIHSDTVCTRF